MKKQRNYLPDLSEYISGNFGVFGDDYRNAKPFPKRKKSNSNRKQELFSGYAPLNQKEALRQDDYNDINYKLSGYDGYNLTGKVRQQ